MTLPEQAFPERALLRRRRQILDEETGATRASHAGPSEYPSADQAAGREDVWVRSFVNRLAGLVRDIGRGGK
jgi:hypothetical protein